MKIRTILVPTDFSKNAQAAFEHAYELATQMGAGLCLLHVQDVSSVKRAVQEGMLTARSTDASIQTEVAKLAKLRFAEMVAGHDKLRVSVQTRVLRGDPDAVIVQVASELPADIIVMGLRGSGVLTKLKTAVAGSVTRSVLMKAPCPVLVVPPAKREVTRRHKRARSAVR